MIDTVSGKKGHRETRLGLGDGDRRRRLAPGSVDVDLSNGCQSSELIETGATDDTESDGLGVGAGKRHWSGNKIGKESHGERVF